MHAPHDQDRNRDTTWHGVLFKPRDWRLGTRFAVLFATVAAVTIALIGTLAYGASATLIRADAESEFDTAVQNLSRQLVVSSQASQDVQENRYAFIAPGSLDAQVLGPDGSWARLLANRHEISSFHPTTEELEVARADEPGIVSTRESQAHEQQYRVGTVSLGEGRGAIQLLQRLSPIEQMVNRLATQILWVGLFVALCAASVGWLVGHRITGRLVRLTDAAEYVSSTGRLDPLTTARAGNGDAEHEEVGGPERPKEPGNDEVTRLTSAFNGMLARLARSKDEQRRLVQDAAHELRTPLTSLRTNVQVLGRVDRLTPDARQRLIDDLQGETRELTDLVNELVGLATGDHEDEPRSAVVLADVAERVAARTRRRTGREILVDADESVVWGRPGALERALANPVENSAKFDPQGRAPIEIRVREGVVEVLDRGPGVEPAELPHLFERFFRATVARGLPGSGLGLSMVREIAHDHGGTVFARNRDGGGSVIGFRLPAHRPAQDDGPTPASG
ncbi:sensor histidine kinase [Nocardiopsis alkaliphila]|uniref:sensor histidine kinase n=1 Tax=Nocardiopsis alkaliphila TaxID=225762 RepID=UPI000347DA17|nr:HAMP domain-containing sensor histidine kinase [Nocardiopsis alkaliphila]